MLPAIKKAKEKSDLVFLLPHCGGQFNIKPGTLSKEIFDKLFSLGADAIIGNHAHTIQKCGINNGRPYAFSLGNVSNSPSYPFLLKESLPDYGMILNVYIEEKKIVKTSFSIIKSIEDNTHYPIVKSIEELYACLDAKGRTKLENDVNNICRRIFEKCDVNFNIQKEYDLSENT